MDKKMKKSFLILLDFINKLYISRYMIRSMVRREIKATYIGSLFGFLWAIINPLSQVVIYGIVFGVFFKATPDPVYGTNSFLLYLLCGLLPWQFFSQSVTAETNSIISNSNLIKKAVKFPSEILPIVMVINNLINHMIGVGLLMAILVFSSVKFSPFMFLIVVYLFFAVIFAIGIGWMLSSMNVYLKDVQQVLGLLMMVWFFFTPVFFPLSIVPSKIHFILKLNPMYHVVEGYRFALLVGRPLSITSFAYLAVSAFVMFGIGGIFFKKLKPGFAETL